MEQEMKDLESQNVKASRDEETLDIFKMASRPVTLKFVEVVYKIKTKTEGLLEKKVKGEEKVILKGITGMVQPGEMLAMLGPSGSGKTTLLTALGGRLLGGRLQGSITYNGKTFNNAMRRNTGFVTQDDVLYPHLTVLETLVFTALLRLSNSFTKEEKILHAEAVIKQLGLTKCKNSIIGEPLERGVSGGERKRVSIGQEMLINPSLLFLDEPTSGLDSTTAQRILSTLRELANGGRTIAMTIHQPSSRLYYLFHKVMLLSEGNPVYFGKGSKALEYFSSVGYGPTITMNPADFLLDLANGAYSDESSENQALVKQKLVSAYKNKLDAELKAELSEISDCDQNQDVFQDNHFGMWPTTWIQQFSVLLRRGVKERKYESFSGLRISQVLLVALISGLLWYKSNISHLQDQIGLLFFIIGFWSFYALFEAIFIFPQERMMLEKERSSGMYRLSSYYMSMIVTDIPMVLVLPTIFLLITYWMAGLKGNVVNFLYTWFSLLFTVLVSQGLGLAIGAMVMDEKSATTLASVVMLTFLLAAGYYVQNVPKFISWVKYISAGYYTYQLIIGSQYDATETYPCSEGHCLVADFPAIKIMGVHGQGLGLPVLALGLMLIGYRLVAYFALMRIGVTKKLA
ncbi:hypothetical protein L6164_022558 [Bauhinia variegata]|uniref:Uncharacterized protein n=1 Tax=Bauhinia variegata TaxID=167791 RepID=A0ACB9MGW1_BAUVA|nr:hypothetical protein L6164_022558 [Bauhinia variegata]